VKLGIVGLGRMGGNMAARMREHGHDVVGYARHPGDRDVDTLAALVEALEPPRVVWVMVPAGDPTESTVNELFDRLDPGDIIIEGGNSNWRDSLRRGAAASDRGLGFIDAGTSGGVWGRTEGYCLMVGGEAEDVAVAQPAFDALAPPGGFAHVGPCGTGHFTKMVHNGIEYGLMQAYAEGFELLSRCGLDLDAQAAISAWRQGSVVRSWLLDLMVLALEQRPNLEGLRGVAQDSGEGRWTVQEAVTFGVPVPVISAALFARFTSQQDESVAMKLVAALREQFGGHAVLPETGAGEQAAAGVQESDMTDGGGGG
jgi:6-phosphogluconate dehydrogenase